MSTLRSTMCCLVALTLCAAAQAQNRIASGSTHRLVQPWNSMPYSVWTNCVLWLSHDTNPSNFSEYTSDDFSSFPTHSATQATASLRPAFTAGRTNGVYNGFVTFDGIDDVYNVQGLSLSGLVAATWMAWIYHNPSAADVNGRIFDSRITNGFILLVNNTPSGGAGLFSALVDTATNDVIQITTSSVGIPSLRWTHVAVKYQTDRLTLFTNAVLCSSITTNSAGTGPIVDNGSILYIGDRSAGDRSFLGYHDDHMIFNRGLTATEITNIYQATRGRYTP